MIERVYTSDSKAYCTKCIERYSDKSRNPIIVRITDNGDDLELDNIIESENYDLLASNIMFYFNLVVYAVIFLMLIFLAYQFYWFFV